MRFQSTIVKDVAYIMDPSFYQLIQIHHIKPVGGKTAVYLKIAFPTDDPKRIKTYGGSKFCISKLSASEEIHCKN